MAPTFGVLTPVSGRAYAPDENALLDRWLAEGLTEALWVRDLPATPSGDPDLGQGEDPFAYLAGLAGRGARPHGVGTAPSSSGPGIRWSWRGRRSAWPTAR